jgi:hypothetical protein
MDEDRGILAQVPGAYIAAAMMSLPDAAVASEPMIDVIAVAPTLGTVRLTFKRFYHRHGKSSRWFWTIERGAREPDQAG